MVEQGIYFALGCIVTALAALMFAPVFWRRALRLTRQRLQLQVPLSMQEILAERDQLRAEFAVERLRIEQALDRALASKASDMAEVGRRSIEVTTIRDQLTATRALAQAHLSEIGAVTRELAESGAMTGALQTELDDVHARLETWRQRAQISAIEESRLRDEAESQRTTIAGLKTRAMGLEMQLTDAMRSAAARLKAVEDGLRSRLEVAMGHATRHESSAILLRRECDDARARIRVLEEQIEALNGPAAASDHLAATHSLEQTPAANGPREGSHDDLRGSIHALGLAVAMMSRRPGAGAAETSAVPRPTRTDAPSTVDAD